MSRNNQRKNRIKKQIRNKFLFIVGILMGLSIILYPLFQQIYYDNVTQSTTNELREAIRNFSPEELKNKNIELAKAYNEALEPNLSWIDPYSEDERLEGLQTYAKMLEVQEKIGVVSIPKIQVELPIYAGTSESILQRGVGHLPGTSLPVGGENTHSVITAHRGLPEARLFTDLDKLEIGDIFSVETIVGKLYYEVDQVLVVEPTETDSVMIEPGEDYLTLLTCTPYMINSHRLLVRGHRIPAPSEEIIEEIEEEIVKDWMFYFKKYWHYLLIIIGTLFVVTVIIKRQK